MNVLGVLEYGKHTYRVGALPSSYVVEVMHDDAWKEVDVATIRNLALLRKLNGIAGGDVREARCTRSRW